MRLSAHLDRESLAKLQALGSIGESGGNAMPKGPKRVRGRNGSLSKSRTVKPRAGTIVASDQVSQEITSNPSSFISIREMRRQLFVPFSELRKLAIECMVIVYKHDQEHYLYRTDFEKLRAEMIRRGYEVRLSEIARILGVPYREAQLACTALKIKKIESEKSDLCWVPAQHFKAIHKWLASVLAVRRRLEQGDQSTHLVSSGSGAMGEGQVSSVQRGYYSSSWRQTEGKRILKRAKDSQKHGYAVVVSGGLPTLGKGRT
ncbi:hypothetical protein [Glutamicibacter sp. PS]|uniref:hypothetical protein n=1 Tax=Glutamicibacter sp. PS TaxID=3075634 RepID=UPI00283DDC11|nr:hypothetical protein [Glutamicibacter sp. PS]MDR4532255.1 hypothetical protein [Glutamicibacter sp. PS]